MFSVRMSVRMSHLSFDNMHAKGLQSSFSFTVEGNACTTMQKSNEGCICFGSERLDSVPLVMAVFYSSLDRATMMLTPGFYEFKLSTEDKISSWKVETASETTSVPSHLIIS